jgi:hypothetical protein
MKFKKIILAIFLASLLGIFTICSPPAYAADSEVLTVDGAFLDGDMLHIEVTDNNSKVKSILDFNFSDYAENTEYITLQAVDMDGNKSAPVKIKNPKYIQPKETETLEIITVSEENVDKAENPEESAIPDGKTFTPDGSAAVLDDLDESGREFFSITTANKNTFYLVIDRQKNGENVYLLNEVTEDDLLEFVRTNTQKDESVIPTTEAVTTTEKTSETTTSEPESKGKTGGLNSGTIIFVVIAVVGIGGAGYYFKIYKNRKKSADNNEDEDEDYDGKTDDSSDNDYDEYDVEGGDENE